MLSSILAGAAIALGASAFLVTDIPFIFSFGIAVIAILNLNLLTGYVPYSFYKKSFSIKDFSKILIGNFIGVLIIALLILNAPIGSKIYTSAYLLMMNKINFFSTLNILSSSILTGIIIGIGIIYYKSANNLVGLLFLLFCITIFVTLGFEHIIANMFYLCLIGQINIKIILMSLIGNFIGGSLTGIIIDKI